MDPLGSFRDSAYRATQQAGDFAAAANTIPDELKRIVQEALDYNKDIIGLRESAKTKYFEAPATGNVRFGVDKFTQGDQAGQENPNFIFNPFERNKAIQDFIGGEEVPFNVYNSLLGMREGTTADTIKAGTNAFNAKATAAQNAATLATQVYKDALTEFKTMEDLRQGQESLDIQRISANKGSGGKDINAFDRLDYKSVLTKSIQDQLVAMQSKGTPITSKVIDSLLQQAYPDFRSIGVGDDEIRLIKSGFQDFITPSVSNTGGNKKPFIGGILGKLTEPGLANRGGLVGAYAPKVGSFIQRGVSNVNDFIQKNK